MVFHRRTILGIFAHPDDESMGPGATLAKYAAAGHRVAFTTATDGGAGRLYDERPTDNTELRKLRREETARAAEIIGAEFLGFLGWQDGDLKNLNVLEVEETIAHILRREKPDVVITFHGSGISYHPDHRVISMALYSAIFGAAREGWYSKSEIESLPPHRVSKAYQYTIARSFLKIVDWPRIVYASPDEEITTVIDTRDTADTKWNAIEAHDTQSGGPPFKLVYEKGGFEKEMFVRVFPTWDPASAREFDLLEGLD